jgi:hypothetical protein
MGQPCRPLPPTYLWWIIFMIEISFLICAPMFCFWIFSLSSTCTLQGTAAASEPWSTLRARQPGKWYAL